MYLTSIALYDLENLLLFFFTIAVRYNAIKFCILTMKAL